MNVCARVCSLVWSFTCVCMYVCLCVACVRVCARVGVFGSPLTHMHARTHTGEDKKRKRFGILRGQSLFLFKSDKAEKERRNKETVWFGGAKVKASVC